MEHTDGRIVVPSPGTDRVPPPWRAWLTSERFVVADRSMEPTLSPGDRVLLDRRAYRTRGPLRGEIVAAEDPEEPKRWIVKRVAGIGPEEIPVPGLGSPEVGRSGAAKVPEGTVFLLSDALSVGRDSRRFGPLPVERVLGRVWYCTGPAARRGPL